MRKDLIFSAAILGLLAVGAGCVGTGQVAIPPDRMNTESALSTAPRNPLEAIERAKTMSAPAVSEQSAENTSMNNISVPTPRPVKFPGILSEAELQGKVAVISTAKGQIVFEIDGQAGPRAASNFIALVKSGFYDGLKFHRVVPGFVIQGGDPLGNGTGGPGYKFEDDQVTGEYLAGTVAMANSGPDTNGSQFFICLEDLRASLEKKYSIFGRVISGLDVVRAISVDDVMESVAIEDRR
ncbi:MAG: peptidylprolyl isomerase [Patescibacteria group bacterium]|jgi:cyclophilin family peptidyl-prolyl cis-trans isomerase